MARDPDHLAGRFETENTGGFLTGFLAEEHVFDRRALLRLVMWGVAAVSAVSIAMVASQSPMALRQDLATEADLARQTQQIQALARESQNETRRLAAAIDTLNGDRDRLFSRTTVLEQGLGSVTGAIARQAASVASAPAAATAPPTMPQSQPTAPLLSPIGASGAKPATGPMAQQSGQAPSPAMAAAPTVMKTEPPSPVATTAPSPAPAATAAARSMPAPTPRPSVVAASPQASASTESPSPNPVPSAAPGPTPAPPIAIAAAKSTEKPPMDTSEPAPRAVPLFAKAAVIPPAAATSDPSPPLMTAKSIMAPPDAAASKLIEPTKPAAADAAAPAPEVVGSVSTEPDPSRSAAPDLPVKRTEFAVDVGGASSVGGLRAMWRGLVRSNPAVAKLSPVIVVKEGSGGLGMQLRLVAGPLDDAAAAAKICAALTESERSCEPTIFDGQRLTVKTDGSPTDAKAFDAKTPATKSLTHKRSSFRRGVTEDRPKRPESSSLSALFGHH